MYHQFDVYLTRKYSNKLEEFLITKLVQLNILFYIIIMLVLG